MDIIELLKSFNRKERFFLIGQALGNKDFILSDDFRNTIQNKLNLEIPQTAFVAMDFHLDWIYASLYCAEKGTTEFVTANPLGLNADQEDVDLLVAFKKDNTHHLIMIEAKAESSWTNKQFASKVIRLRDIFGFNNCIWKNVKPYFLITSPRKPKALRIEALPIYLQRSMEEIWFPLNIPADLLKITRCDANGKALSDGLMWKVERP